MPDENEKQADVPLVEDYDDMITKEEESHVNGPIILIPRLDKTWWQRRVRIFEQAQLNAKRRPKPPLKVGLSLSYALYC